MNQCRGRYQPTSMARITDSCQKQGYDTVKAIYQSIILL